jgi:ABC-2 type transport system ATP-binding protein
MTQGLCKQFGETVAVDQLDLEIAQGEIFGFLGHNGAGKTTTVRLLNGVLTRSAGAISVLGMDPDRDGARIRARTGVLTETPALDDRLTARETLRYFAAMFGVPRARINARVDELLERMDLAERGNDKVGSFSKGMRQRLALARTLLHSPEIVFLDEPTSGLDPVGAREVHQLIARLRRENRTVFLCTHNLFEAERLCDRMAILARGKVLAMGTLNELAGQLKHGHRTRIEIDDEQAATARAALADCWPSLQVELLEERGFAGVATVLLVHGGGRALVAQMVDALSGAGVQIYRVEPDEPSLEDVYFQLEHV